MKQICCRSPWRSQWQGWGIILLLQGDVKGGAPHRYLPVIILTFCVSGISQNNYLGITSKKNGSDQCWGAPQGSHPPKFFGFLNFQVYGGFRDFRDFLYFLDFFGFLCFFWSDLCDFKIFCDSQDFWDFLDFSGFRRFQEFLDFWDFQDC